MRLKNIIKELKNKVGYDNLKDSMGEPSAELIYSLVEEVEKADRELDIVHRCITDLYEADSCRERIKNALDEIDELNELSMDRRKEIEKKMKSLRDVNPKRMQINVFWETPDPISDNSLTMEYYLDNFLPLSANILEVDGSYAKIELDGVKYAIHASGSGDFYNHKVECKLLKENDQEDFVLNAEKVKAIADNTARKEILKQDWVLEIFKEIKEAAEDGKYSVEVQDEKGLTELFRSLGYNISSSFKKYNDVYVEIRWDGFFKNAIL